MLCCVLLLSVVITARSEHRPIEQSRNPNVIVMVPDGSSQSIQTLARWYKGAPLNLDGLNSGTAMTHMANSIITGSAAAGTAFATGHKTSARFLGVGPRTDDLLSGFLPTAAPYEPVASVLEAAKLKGKSVGLVVTSCVSHATPAAFGSHIHDRGLENEIMEQMVYQDMDVVFGGGASYLIPQKTVYATTFGHNWKGRRSDRENLMDVLEARGYQFVDSKFRMAKLESGPVWGLFADRHLSPQMDRAWDTTQPSLGEMTVKAIEILSQDPDGFFLMVEGSLVDWAAHANDSAYMVTEYLAFDEAVGRALDFARKDGQTSVYIWPDHNTGGLTIGNNATFCRPGFPERADHRPIYGATSIEALIAPLKRMRLSAGALAERIGQAGDPDKVKAVLSAYWGIEATNRDLREISALKKVKTGIDRTLGLTYALCEVVNRNHLIVGWTSHGHCGEDVPVWSYGPRQLVGTFDNTELARQTALTLGVDLEQTTGRLFIDLAFVTPDFSLDTRDKTNPKVVIGEDISLPVNKDILRIGNQTHRLSGIVVHAPKADNGRGKVFIPWDAAALIRSFK